MKIKLLFLLVTFTFSCSTADIKPFTKDMYLHRYHQFVLTIEQNYHSFDSQDWESLDDTYMHYSTVWYQDFKSQMNTDERKFVRQLSNKYHYYKLLATGQSVAKTLEQWLLDAENTIIK